MYPHVFIIIIIFTNWTNGLTVCFNMKPSLKKIMISLFERAQPLNTNQQEHIWRKKSFMWIKSRTGVSKWTKNSSTRKEKSKRNLYNKQRCPEKERLKT